MAPRDGGATHVAFGSHDGLGHHNVVISWLNPRCRGARNTRYRAARYALPRRDFHPLDRASFAWRTVW